MKAVVIFVCGIFIITSTCAQADIGLNHARLDSSRNNCTHGCLQKPVQEEFEGVGVAAISCNHKRSVCCVVNRLGVVEVMLFNTTNLKPSLRVELGHDAVRYYYSCSLNPDGTIVAAGTGWIQDKAKESEINFLQLYDISNLKKVREMLAPKHSLGVRSQAFRDLKNNMHLLATGDIESVIRLYLIGIDGDIKLLSSFMHGYDFLEEPVPDIIKKVDSKSDVSCLEFNPAMETLASYSGYSVVIWNITNLLNPVPLDTLFFQFDLYGIKFSADGHFFATGGKAADSESPDQNQNNSNKRYDSVSLFNVDLATGEMDLSQNLFHGQYRELSIDFSQDGKYMLVGGGSIVSLWNISSSPDARKLDTYEHQDKVNTVAFMESKGINRVLSTSIYRMDRRNQGFTMSLRSCNDRPYRRQEIEWLNDYLSSGFSASLMYSSLVDSRKEYKTSIEGQFNNGAEVLSLLCKHLTESGNEHLKLCQSKVYCANTTISLNGLKFTIITGPQPYGPDAWKDYMNCTVSEDCTSSNVGANSSDQFFVLRFVPFIVQLTFFMYH